MKKGTFWDLGQQLWSLRPDRVTTSEASRHLTVLEPTVPWKGDQGLVEVLSGANRGG